MRRRHFARRVLLVAALWSACARAEQPESSNPPDLPPPPPKPTGAEPSTGAPAAGRIEETRPPSRKPATSRKDATRIHDGFFARATLGFAQLSWRGSTQREQTTTPAGTSFPAPLSPRDDWTDTGAVADLALGFSPIAGAGAGVALVASSYLFPSVENAQNADYGYYYGEFGLSLRGLGLLVVLRPNPRGGLSSGVALTSLGAGSREGPVASGFAVTPELGYDIWIAERTSLGIVGRVLFARLTSDERGARRVANVAAPSLSLALWFE